MKKALCLIVLLLGGALVLTSAGSQNANPAYSPVIIARGKLVNQTAPIAKTTILTPTVDSVYQLSIFAVLSRTDPNSQSIWTFGLAWTDDSGQDEGGYLWRQGAAAGQFSDDTNNTDGGIVRTIEVKAGMPLTYAMNQQGPPDNSAYSLYYVVERLE